MGQVKVCPQMKEGCFPARGEEAEKKEKFQSGRKLLSYIYFCQKSEYTKSGLNWQRLAKRSRSNDFA